MGSLKLRLNIASELKGQQGLQAVGCNLGEARENTIAMWVSGSRPTVVWLYLPTEAIPVHRQSVMLLCCRYNHTGVRSVLN